MVSQSDNPTRTPQNAPNPLKLRTPFAGNMLVKGGDMPKILAIDDDRTVLRLIEKAFEGADVELTTVTNAEEGMTLLLKGGIDVCLLDIMLPEMNGLELAKKIRSIDARMPVIFITSMDDSDTAIEAMKLGAYEFCTKPLDIAQVQDFVERAFNTRRLMAKPVAIQESADACLLYTSPSPRDRTRSRMPSSA